MWIQAPASVHGLFRHDSSYCDVLRVKNPDGFPLLEKNQSTIHIGWNSEQSGQVRGIPAHGSRVRTTTSLMALPIQPLYDFMISLRMMY